MAAVSCPPRPALSPLFPPFPLSSAMRTEGRKSVTRRPRVSPPYPQIFETAPVPGVPPPPPRPPLLPPPFPTPPLLLRSPSPLPPLFLSLSLPRALVASEHMPRRLKSPPPLAPPVPCPPRPAKKSEAHLLTHPAPLRLRLPPAPPPPFS